MKYLGINLASDRKFLINLPRSCVLNSTLFFGERFRPTLRTAKIDFGAFYMSFLKRNVMKDCREPIAEVFMKQAAI